MSSFPVLNPSAPMSGYPDNNPKTVFGMSKPGIADIPPVAFLHLGRAMTDGQKKYGRTNWREHHVTSSVYYNAMGRHMAAWWDGENVAPDSLVHHLGHVMACCAIILDAEAQGSLRDDRPSIPGKFSELVKQFTAPMTAATETPKPFENSDYHGPIPPTERLTPLPATQVIVESNPSGRDEPWLEKLDCGGLPRVQSRETLAALRRDADSAVKAYRRGPDEGVGIFNRLEKLDILFRDKPGLRPENVKTQDALNVLKWQLARQAAEDAAVLRALPVALTIRRTLDDRF